GRGRLRLPQAEDGPARAGLRPQPRLHPVGLLDGGRRRHRRAGRRRFRAADGLSGAAQVRRLQGPVRARADSDVLGGRPVVLHPPPAANGRDAMTSAGADLRIAVFADGANLEAMLTLADDPLVKGFTTNPTLMRQSGVREYAAFARTVLRAIPDKPIS